MVLVHAGDAAAPDPDAQAARRARGQPVAPPVGRRSLVLGGTRSGKSRHAEDLLPADAPVRYLATARRHDGDAEWDARIAAHAARRPAVWTTVEEPDVPALLRVAGPVLVDDLATWLTGVLDDAGAWELPDVPPW